MQLMKSEYLVEPNAEDVESLLLETGCLKKKGLLPSLIQPLMEKLLLIDDPPESSSCILITKE